MLNFTLSRPALFESGLESNLEDWLDYLLQGFTMRPVSRACRYFDD